MGLVHIDEMSFELPDGWEDKTLNVFADGPEGKSVFNVVVSRDDLDGEELPAFIDGQLASLVRSQPHYSVMGKRATTAGGLPAVESKLRMRTKVAVIYQRQVAVAYYGRVLMFTAASPMRLSSQCDAYLSAMMQSVKFRKV